MVGGGSEPAGADIFTRIFVPLAPTRLALFSFARRHGSGATPSQCGFRRSFPKSVSFACPPGRPAAPGEAPRRFGDDDAADASLLLDGELPGCAEARYAGLHRWSGLMISGILGPSHLVLAEKSWGAILAIA